MPFRILSWNTQGNAREKVSTKYGDLLLPHEKGENILLLQEAGIPSNFGTVSDDGKFEWKIGRVTYTGMIIPQENAINKRCSVAVLFQDDTKYFIGFQNINLDGVRRPVLMAVHKDGFFIATWHATANFHEAFKELKIVCEFMNKNYKSWILMGDFNIHADELKKYPGFNVVAASAPTQTSGRTLDYAIVSNDLVKHGLSLGVLNGGGSDHLPVYIDL